MTKLHAFSLLSLPFLIVVSKTLRVTVQKTEPVLWASCHDGIKIIN